MIRIDCHITGAIFLAAFLSVAGCATDMSTVGPEVRTAIENRFPGAEVKEVEPKFGGLYEIELTDGEASREVKISQKGTIVEIETAIDACDLPQPVAETVATKSGGAEVTEVEKVELLAKHTSAGIEPLAEPEIFYEIEWTASGFEHEIEVNADGTLR